MSDVRMTRRELNVKEGQELMRIIWLCSSIQLISCVYHMV